MYPPALLKNTNIPLHHSALSGFDISADFNSAMPFWFSSGNQSMKSTDYDFEYVLIHELTVNFPVI